MAFQVDITEPALIDAEDHIRFIREMRKEPGAADRWFRGLVQAIYKNYPIAVQLSQSKKSFPSRFAISYTSRIE